VKKLSTFAVACTAVLGTAGLAAAQGMPAMPKPGPEHAIFKDVAGNWDAKVESFMAPGGPPSVSNGTETSRVGCGGLCLISDFKGSFVMGPPGTPATPFEGHGTETYDTSKKKYVGSWTDSMSTGLSVTEATHDAATKTMTGKLTRFIPGSNHAQLIFEVIGPDGKPVMNEGKPLVWGVETGSAAAMARQGVTVDSFPQGTILTVSLHPLRDGRPFGAIGGALINCGTTLPAGGCNEKTGKSFLAPAN